MRLCRDLAASFRLFNATETSDGKIGAFVKTDNNIEKLLNKAKSALEKEGYLDFKMIPRYKALYIKGATRSDLISMDEVLAIALKSRPSRKSSTKSKKSQPRKKRDTSS